MSQNLSRRSLLAVAAAGVLAVGMTPAVAQAASAPTNGIHKVYVSGVTVNATNKKVTVAVGPNTPGATIPAGSTWNYTVNVWAQYPGEGVNAPTTSQPNTYGSWAAPRLVAKEGDKHTFALSWTNKVPLSTTYRGPVFQWVNSSNSLRPGSDIQVISSAPDGAVADQDIFGNQRQGTYYYN
ncbi:MAG: hypothetical protein Q4F65_02400 [Propionibacteriaceae bacterium]|nr:hypothetical protein [Propionibacteriaceae bacterium]